MYICSRSSKFPFARHRLVSVRCPRLEGLRTGDPGVGSPHPEKQVSRPAGVRHIHIHIHMHIHVYIYIYIYIYIPKGGLV